MSIRMGLALTGFTMLVSSACNDDGIRPGMTMSIADSADQRIIGMSTRIVDNGLQKSHVMADTAYVYTARQQTDLRRLRVTLYDDQGKQSAILTAKQAYYYQATGSLDARGDVQVDTPDGTRLRTEHLVYDPSARTIVGDTAFTYTSPTENMRGDSFTSDLDFRQVRIDRPRGRQKGEGVAVPGQ